MVIKSTSTLLTALLTASVALPAGAHSWYPRECCSNQDCMAADEILTDSLGHKSVRVGQVQIPIPDGVKSGLSPDGRVHVCFQTWAAEQHGLPTFMLICLFVPPVS